MKDFGFLRVAAAVPTIRVGDCAHNAAAIVDLLRRAEAEQVAVVVFPELCVTGYTCADLFQQTILQQGALDALAAVVQASCAQFSGLAVVGVPLLIDDQLYNCAAVLQQGRVVGVVPKSYIPNYKEFYERRWFAPAAVARARRSVLLFGEPTPFGTSLLFECAGVQDLVIGVEICEDLWVPIPPSSAQALSGATVLLNLSASNELIGKAAYRRQLVVNQSGRCVAAYVYSSCGVRESTTDVVFGGHCLIAENGVLLAESQRFQREESLLTTDVDLQRLHGDRLRTSSFGDAQRDLPPERVFRRISFSLEPRPAPAHLLRDIDAHPFVPRGQDKLDERCQEIFHIQVAGLAKRLEHLGSPVVTIGVSGGLDSTLALLVTRKTFDRLGLPADRIHGFTLPGFGTTERTRRNAYVLMQVLGVSLSDVDIRELCLAEMRALGHRPFGIDLEGISPSPCPLPPGERVGVRGLTVEEFAQALQGVPPERRQDLVFENVQARMRTSILMNAGFAIGTGDLSELALGWCTYNGDHISMYNPNISIPKTLVKFLVRWVADNEFTGEARQTLLDIVATEISPELLPIGADGLAIQATEQVIGPYELHDFFLFHFLRHGSAPEKILYLVQQARFERSYSTQEVRRWLQVFIQRFFANQFKRSCLPDGPKVGTVSLSPRGDWRMPSDAQVNLWLEWAKREEPKSPTTDGAVHSYAAMT